MSKPPLEKLRVMRDPILGHKHPYHENRYVCTGTEPFEVAESEDGWTCADDTKIICSLTDCEQQREYARLFAAAPELLEACKQAEAWLDNLPLGHGSNEALPILRRAIELAEGGDK